MVVIKAKRANAFADFRKSKEKAINISLSQENQALKNQKIPKKEKAFHSSNYNKLEEHERLTFSSESEHTTIISLEA